MQYPNRYRTRQSERGAAAVEFAILAPLLFFVLIGMVEFALIAHSKMMVAQAARAGTRAAALGKNIEGIEDAMMAASPTIGSGIKKALDPNRREVDFVMEKGPGQWVALDNGDCNDFGENCSGNSAERGQMVSVHIRCYKHHLVMGQALVELTKLLNKGKVWANEKGDPVFIKEGSRYYLVVESNFVMQRE